MFNDEEVGRNNTHLSAVMLRTWTPACNTRRFLSKETDEVCSSTSETDEDEDMEMF